jgi:hypothetical protein
MYEKELKTAVGEKITVTTRLNSLGKESVMLCIAGKSGKFIVDIASPLEDEEVAFLIGALQAAQQHSKKVNND